MTTNTQFLLIMQSSLFRIDGPEIDLMDSIINLCECINNDPMETDWSIGECTDCTLDSLLIGFYWALTEWHGGQYSDDYAAICAIGSIFSPGMSSGPEEDSGEQVAYEALCEYFDSRKI